MIRLTTDAIDPAAVLAEVASPAAGAVLLFLGTARNQSDGRPTASLDYESYNEMASKMLVKIEAEARQRWPLVGCAVIHRVGHLEIGEASVAVAVSSAHRNVAFAAGQWLIDTLKEIVPIWKRENWADGSSAWVHSGLPIPPDIEAPPPGF
jgi:molybdopterin synthase catalytic subunit